MSPETFWNLFFHLSSRRPELLHDFLEEYLDHLILHKDFYLINLYLQTIRLQDTPREYLQFLLKFLDPHQKDLPIWEDLLFVCNSEGYLQCSRERKSDPPGVSTASS